jgi:hypothetical protein
MYEPITVKALTDAMDTSAKIAQSPGLMTVADRLFGFKLSEWKAQGDIVKTQKQQEYKEASEKGLGLEYVTAFRDKANVLNTLSKATDHVKENFVREIEFDEDVFWNLIEHAKTISQEDVQDLVARIIAGEYNERGTYSSHTLQVLKSLGRQELDQLEKLGCLIVNDNMIPVNLFEITDGYEAFIEKIGISFTDFQTLQSLGLVHNNSATREINNEVNNKLAINYFDRQLIFSPEKEVGGTVKIPSFYPLTETGKQILQHLAPSINETYCDWLKLNYKISSYVFKDVTNSKHEG